MSKKLTELLKNLGVENVEDTLANLLNDEYDNAELVPQILKNAQTYSKPFLETEFNEKFNNERTTLKGKYLKEALLKVNKTFGTPLTNKEIDEVIANPENTGKTFDVAVDLLKEKVSTKTGTSENELQKMLDSANSKIQDYEAQIPTLETKYKNEYEQAINKFKVDGVVSNKLLKILEGKTTIPVEKAIKIIKNELSEKAILKLKEDGNISLYDLANSDVPLKKNETTLQDFEGLINDIVEDLGMSKQSNGTTQLQTNTQQQNNNTQEVKEHAGKGLAEKMATLVN